MDTTPSDAARETLKRIAPRALAPAPEHFAEIHAKIAGDGRSSGNDYCGFLLNADTPHHLRPAGTLMPTQTSGSRSHHSIGVHA